MASHAFVPSSSHGAFFLFVAPTSMYALYSRPCSVSVVPSKTPPRKPASGPFSFWSPTRWSVSAAGCGSPQTHDRPSFPALSVKTWTCGAGARAGQQ